MEVEFVHNTVIPLRPLNEEESNREITLERFEEYHSDVQEDFSDQCGDLFNHQVYGGYLLCKYPNKSTGILEEINHKHGEIMGFKDIYDGDDDDRQFYTDLAEYINLTIALKKRVNQVLIQTAEHYK